MLLIYFRACGFKLIAFLFCFVLANNVTSFFSNYWLSSWSISQSEENRKTMHLTDRPVCPINRNSIELNSCKCLDFYESIGKLTNKMETNQNATFSKFFTYFLIAFSDNILQAGSHIMVRIMSLKASNYFHTKLLDSTLRSTMRFFESTPCGRIVNQFSKDISNTEWSLPNNFRNIISCYLRIAFVITLVGYTTPWYLLVLYFILINRQK